MADSNNPGQFGNRDDTIEQASKGGQASTGSFGDKNSADPAEAGRRSSGNTGNPEQHAEAGRQSHKND